MIRIYNICECKIINLISFWHYFYSLLMTKILLTTHLAYKLL